MDPPSLHLPLPLLYQEEIKDQADIFLIGYKQDWPATIQLSREASQIEAVARFCSTLSAYHQMDQLPIRLLRNKDGNAAELSASVEVENDHIS